MEVSRRIRAYMELQGMVPMKWPLRCKWGRPPFTGG